MKTNEEFLREVYGKRDRVVKKRKKQMAFAATAVCAVLCIGAAATAGIFGEQNNINKSTEIEYENNMASNVNAGEYKELYADVEDVTKHYYPEIVTDVDNFTVNPEDMSEVAEGIVVEDSVGAVTKPIIQNNFGNDGKELAEEEGFAQEVTVQTDEVIELATEPVANDGGEVKATMPAAPKEPMPSTEEIVEAALTAIPEDEKAYIIIESAESTVTRYADGKQEYTVGFRTTQDKYIKVKLDSELNPIKAGS